MITFELNIPDDAWEETGVDPGDMEARLSTEVRVNGVGHHLEAFQVKVNEKTDIQEAADIVFESNIGGICDVAEPDGHWQTVTIRGKEYVLAMTPFC
jgi:hypothetical protein